LVEELSETLSLHYENRFPYRANLKWKNGYRVLIGIGGNIGDTKRRFHHLFYRMERDKNLRVVETSPILKNPPFGYLNQNFFFNAVIIVETKLSPKSFLKRVLYLEKRFGRVRTFKNAPRTLDIDIIFFDKLKIKSRNLVVPHRDWQNRESVVIPFSRLERGYF